MNNEIYIGKNGIGKSEKLLEISRKESDNSLFLRFSEKNNAPDSSVINKTNELFKNFEKFFNDLFKFETNVELSSLDNEAKDKFEKIKKEILSSKELEKKWEEMLEDKDLNFISDISNAKGVTSVIKSAKNLNTLKINQEMYWFDLSKWKDTKGGIKSYGTGKLMYFQIKFLYFYIDLIKPNDKKFLIIDEPELFLHSELKRKIGFMLKKIGEKINVIVASHSPEFLASFFYNQTTKIFTKKDYTKNDWIEINLKKPKVFTSIIECFESLMSDKIIIVEGGNDYKLIEHIINNHLWNYNVRILISNRKDNIKSKVDVLLGVKTANEEAFFNKNDIFILFDEDSKKLESLVNSKEKHKDVNESIKNIGVWYFAFDDNLEKYFVIKNKDKWDVEEFFENQKNKEKLGAFILKSKIKDFLEQK